MIDVKYPDNEKKENSISLICDKTKQKKKNAFIFLYGSYREIGITVILKKSVFPYLLSVVLYTLGIALQMTILKSAHNNENTFANVLSAFFFAAPVITQLSELLYYVHEAPAGVLEYCNSYKYTAYQMSLLRMPLLSVATMAVNYVIAVVWCVYNDIGNVLALLSVIACSVFFYSLVNAALFTRFKRAGFVMTAVLWFIINCVQFNLSAQVKIALFVTVPYVIHVVAAVMFVVVFVKVVERSYLKPAGSLSHS